jgi:hypothetical protein
VAHNIPHIDLVCGASQHQPTPAPTQCVNKPTTAKVMNHLYQMVFRNAVRFRYLPDGDAAVSMHAQIEQRAQGIVGVEGQTHKIKDTPA